MTLISSYEEASSSSAEASQTPSSETLKQGHGASPKPTGRRISSIFQTTEQLSASLRIPRISMRFQPFFVENYWRTWHINTNLASVDRVALQLDIVIWMVCIIAVEPLSWLQLHTTLYFVLSIVFLIIYTKCPEWYMRHRTAITSLRWWLTYPYTSARLGAKVAHATGPWRAVLWHFVGQPCAYHSVCASLSYLDSWHIAASNALLDILILGRLQKLACNMLLSGPYADTQPWRRVAAMFDKMTAGVYHGMLQEHSMSPAVCRTTATTVHVLLSVSAVCIVYCMEWQYRMRFKQQLPASVAARQKHLYRSPWYMVLSQILLLVLYPTIAITWLLAGIWHGLAAGTAG